MKTEKKTKWTKEDAAIFGKLTPNINAFDTSVKKAKEELESQCQQNETLPGINS